MNSAIKTIVMDFDGTISTLRQAAEAATLCSAVTVKKLNTTGTATAREILELA